MMKILERQNDLSAVETSVGFTTHRQTDIRQTDRQTDRQTHDRDK